MKKIIQFALLTIVLPSVMFAQEQGKARDFNAEGKAYFDNAFYKLTPKQRKSEAIREYKRAIVAFEKSIEANPNDLSAYKYLARIYSAMKRPAEAAKAYQKVIELNPSDVDMYVFAALAYTESGAYDIAVKTLQNAKGYTDDVRILQKIDEYIQEVKLHRTQKEVSDVK